MFGIVISKQVALVGIHFEMCTFAKDLVHVSFNSSVNRLSFLFRHAFHFFSKPNFFLNAVFKLLTDGDFITCIYQHLDILL